MWAIQLFQTVEKNKPNKINIICKIENITHYEKLFTAVNFYN
jgi:hypothetical protein